MVSLGQQYSIGDQGEEKKNFYLSGMSKCPRCGNGTRSSSCSAGCRMNGDAYGTDVCTTNLFWPSVEPWHSYSLVFEFMLTVKTAGIPLFLWMEHVVPVGRGVRHVRFCQRNCDFYLFWRSRTSVLCSLRKLRADSGRLWSLQLLLRDVRLAERAAAAARESERRDEGVTQHP